MLICHSRRVAFIHIPKTGGTAIERLFSGLDVLRFGSHHNRVRDLPEECRNYFVFAVVRNPYTRLASWYRFRVRRDSERNLARRFFSPGDFLRYELDRKARLRQVEFIDDRVSVFRFENLDEAARVVAARLGVEPTLAKGADTNYFGGYDFRAELDIGSVEFINDHCAEDFNVFGYERMTWEQLNG